MDDSQNTLRSMLEANLTASENGTLGQPTEVAVEIQNTEVVADKSRDDKGRFAQQKETAEVVPENAAPIEQAAPVVRPTTWKKEYLPIYDKINSGIPLTPEESKKLADYSVQREREYATGVSSYKEQAVQAKEVQSAMDPFMQTLQQHNMKPAEWITNLGNAHKTLVFGTPEEKIQMFSNMAQQYGIPLQAITQGNQGQLDPIVPQLMKQIQDLSGKVNTVTSWREQAETQVLQQEISKFQDAEKYPHFESVRGDMAQLLESGIAKNLDNAYEKAVRMNDDVWSAEQERQAQAQAVRQAADKAAAVSKAKTNNVSPKSTTPSGVSASNVGKDRRALLEAAFDSSGGRV